jgi:hypothetical protein
MQHKTHFHIIRKYRDTWIMHKTALSTAREAEMPPAPSILSRC